ncbi:MAG: tripartite tricarboxylate transporter TctB family protein [Paracoccaceae bacterium]
MSNIEKPVSDRRSFGAIMSSPGALLFTLALGLAMAGYAWSIADGARRVTDWLLIIPAALVGVAALVFALAGDVRALISAPAPSATPKHDAEAGSDRPEALADAGRTRRVHPDLVGFALMVLVLGYALTLPWLGFDIGTAIFVAIALFLQGERHWGRLIFISIGSAGLFVFVFTTLLAVRLPTVFM